MKIHGCSNDPVDKPADKSSHARSGMHNGFGEGKKSVKQRYVMAERPADRRRRRTECLRAGVNSVVPRRRKINSRVNRSIGYARVEPVAAAIWPPRATGVRTPCVVKGRLIEFEEKRRRAPQPPGKNRPTSF